MGPLFEPTGEPVFQTTIDTSPISAPRPRARVVGRGPAARAQIYMPPAYERYVTRLRTLLRGKHRGPPLTCPVQVGLEFVFARPMHIPKWVTVRGQHFPNPYPLCVRQLDVDNLAKTALDALQPGVILDDRLVTELRCTKVYGELPMLKVTLWRA